MKPFDHTSLRLARLFTGSAILLVASAILPRILADLGAEDGSEGLLLRDTYFFIPDQGLLIGLASGALVIAFTYFRFTSSTGLRLDRWLGWTHFVGSIAPIISLCVMPLMMVGQATKYNTYDDLAHLMKTVELSGAIVSTTFSIALFAQALFLINLAYSPFRTRVV